LDTAERQKFSSLNACCAGSDTPDSLEYLVTQTQEAAGATLTGPGIQGNTALFHNHPCVELISMFRNQANATKPAPVATSWRGGGGSADVSNYTLHTHTSAVVGGAASVRGDSVQSLDLLLNNHSCVDQLTTDPKFWRLCMPYMHHQGASDDMLYTICHALNCDDDVSPSGSANWSRVDNISAQYTTAAGVGAAVIVQPFFIASNYNIFRATAGMGGLVFHS
jgi:hypothetical protein